MAYSIVELTKIIEDHKALIKKEGENTIKQAFKDLFDKYPVLDKVYWQQYTDYYCDGDPVSFSRYDMYPIFTKDSYASDEDLVSLYEDAEWEELTQSGYPEDHLDLDEASEALLALDKAFKSLEDVFESVFGDHISVLASREGFEINEQDHD